MSCRILQQLLPLCNNTLTFYLKIVYHKFVFNENSEVNTMVIMSIKLNHIYGFDDFQIDFTYPRKLSVSLLEK